MKGKWKAYCQNIGGKMKYIAGRQLDMSKLLYSGNIEFTGTYEVDGKLVFSLCEKLNAEMDVEN